MINKNKEIKSVSKKKLEELHEQKETLNKEINKEEKRIGKINIFEIKNE